MRGRQAVAVIAVTVLSLAIIGTVLVTATSLGCGPAKALGLKSVAARCAQPVAARTPGIPSPSPLLSATPTTLPSSSPSSVPSPSPIPSPSPLPSSSIPDTGPASSAYPPYYPAASAPNTTPALALDCRLPVFAGPSGSGGFIVFPGGSYIADPSSAVQLPSPAPGSPTPYPQGGYGMGPQGGLSYDVQFRKWLPVSLSQVTPDGTRYAFLSPTSIYVEDVAAGTLSQIGTGHAWQIVAVESAGVYAMQQGAAGLWLVPYSGDPRQITSAGYWQTGNAAYAYGTPTSAVPNGADNQIIRVDLSSGAVETWFSRTGTQDYVIGVTADGAAIVNVQYYAYNNVGETWIVPQAGNGFPIAGTYYTYQGVALNGPTVADANGIWFGSGGIALYVSGKGVYGMSNLSAQLAGACFQP